MRGMIEYLEIKFYNFLQYKLLTFLQQNNRTSDGKLPVTMS